MKIKHFFSVIITLAIFLSSCSNQMEIHGEVMTQSEIENLVMKYEDHIGFLEGYADTLEMMGNEMSRRLESQKDLTLGLVNVMRKIKPNCITKRIVLCEAQTSFFVIL